MSSRSLSAEAWWAGRMIAHLAQMRIRTTMRWRLMIVDYGRATGCLLALGMLLQRSSRQQSDGVGNGFTEGFEI